MGSVTKRAIAAVLATTEVYRAIFFSCVGNRGKVASLVGTVAEWLGGAFATGAPVIGLAVFDFNGHGRFLSDDRFGHKSKS